VSLDCKNPGKCIEMAKMLIDSILPKWNPTINNTDLEDELALTADEVELNSRPLQLETITTFDPNFSLAKMNDGFRIFAFEESMNEIPTRRTKLPGPPPTLLTVFLHAHILKPGEFKPLIKVTITSVTENSENTEILSMTFDQAEIPMNFSSALLGGLLHVLYTTTKNTPLLICSSSDFLARVLVKEKKKFENNFLDPKFKLLKAVIASLNERVA
jgi:hypothetical protein